MTILVSMNSMVVGDVEITQLVDVVTVRMDRGSFYPDCDQLLWERNRSWLAPDSWDPDADEVLMVVQGWLVRSGDRTVLVDTGLGSTEEQQSPPFLEALRRADVRAEDVDLVVCTHLHGDHVGWNTRRVGDTFVSTFPRARYLLARADYDFYHPRTRTTARSGENTQAAFERCVAPIEQAGQLDLWEEAQDLDAALRLEPAPGHTPGSSVLTLRSGNERAVFVGDMMHGPLQVTVPDCCPASDEDPAQARATRRRVLGWAADENALVVPAHFHAGGALQVRRDGSTFAIRDWHLRR